jgi:hypothetical protein
VHPPILARRILPEQWPSICTRAQRGESLRALSTAYEVSHETIRRILHGSASLTPHARRPIPAQGTRPS